MDQQEEALLILVLVLQLLLVLLLQMFMVENNKVTLWVFMTPWVVEETMQHVVTTLMVVKVF